MHLFRQLWRAGSLCKKWKTSFWEPVWEHGRAQGSGLAGVGRAPFVWAHTKAPWSERYALWKDCSRRQKRVPAALIPLHSALPPFSKSKNVVRARAKRFHIFNRSAKRFSNRACTKKIFFQLHSSPSFPLHPSSSSPKLALCVFTQRLRFV